MHTASSLKKIALTPSPKAKSKTWVPPSPSYHAVQKPVSPGPPKTLPSKIPLLEVNNRNEYGALGTPGSLKKRRCSSNAVFLDF